MKKLATTVLVVVIMLLSSCTKDEVDCQCWVEEPIGSQYRYHRRSDIKDCDRDGELLYNRADKTGPHWLLKCKHVDTIKR